MRPIRTFGFGTALACALLAFATVLPAQTTRDKYAERARSAFRLATTNAFTYNVNNWLCGIDDAGRLCVNTFFSTTGGGGFWPVGTSNQYIFDMGLQMAAKDPVNPGEFVAAHCFNVSATQAQCTPVTEIFHSDDPDDLAAWPNECFLTNPQTGERVKTLSQLDTCAKYWDGNPATSVPGGHPMGVQVVQHSLAFTLEGFRDMIFFIFNIKNVSNTPAFQSANAALGVPAEGWTLDSMYVAVGHDADVSSDEVDENFGTFVPFLLPPTPSDPVGVPLWLGTIWQADFVAGDFEPYSQCGFCSNPGFVGTTFLRSPYNNTGDTIFNAAANRQVPPIDPVTLEQLRLLAAVGDEQAQDSLAIHEIGQSFGSLTTRGGTFPDPTNAGQSFRYYSGNLSASERAAIPGTPPPGFGFVDQPTTADTRYFHATGPFTLAPGDSVEIIMGVVAGAPVLSVPGFSPGTIVPHGLPGDTTRSIEQIMGRGNLAGLAYPSLFKQVLDARSLFETNFLLPAPPPSPLVTAIPGDRQVSVTWSDDPVNAADEYFEIAQQRGIPGYREFDFEGFRVYRKVRPNAEFELIAQFDLKNGLTDVVTTTDSVLNADGVYVVVRADTAHAGTDTGLQFAIIDRGGSFPDPSNGPGLINGVTYFYAVTAYDINTPFAPGGSSLESSRRLTRNSQDIGGAGAIPRSTASGREAFRVSAMRTVGGGVALDPTASVSIDPVTGTFSGPQPPTNAVGLEIVPVDEVLMSTGDVSITIDSVVSLNGFESVLGVHQQLAPPNGLGVTVAYFGTLQTPDGSQLFRKEVTSPFGLFGSPELTNEEFVNQAIRADSAKAAQLGRTADHNGATLTGSVTFGPTFLDSGTEAVSALRTGSVGSEGGSRWFVGQEPAEPTLVNAAGQLPGVTQILNVADQYAKQADPAVRWFIYLSEPLMRAADFEVTWGANGEIDRVMDLTHNVEVPFSDHYGATWGIRNEVSGDAILSIGDFWLTTPIAEWYCEATGCHFPLDSVAVIQAMSTDPPASFDTDVAAANSQGFGLFISGEMFLFETTQLPAAGTTWILRSYAGEVVKDAVTNEYSFDPVPNRPFPVPGLTFELTIEEATSFDLASASLDQVHTVPDPFIVRSALQTSAAERKILFVNLPVQATIRIFSLSGVLVDAVVHDDPSGGGSAEWDLRNRNNQYVASGVYFYHIETPDGKEKLGKFTIVQGP